VDERFRLHPEQASSFAHDVDGLYFFLIAVSAFFTVLIFCAIVYFAIKYRRRSEDEEAPRPIYGSLGLEVLWSVVPFIFAMIFFFWGARAYFHIARPPANAMEIYVTGKQWMWKMQHPNGTREINTLHVPLGQPVKLIMSSQDVVHSYYIPAFRVKQDVVPGRYTVLWFEPTKVGEFHLFCAEYCGTQHSGMIGRVVVMEPQEYEAWLSGTVPDEPPAVTGARLFTSLGCQTCHSAQAPTMAGLFGSRVELQSGKTIVADEHYLRRSIMDSTSEIVKGFQPIMPSFRGQVSEEQLTALIAYIKSARSSGTVSTTRPSATSPAAGDAIPLEIDPAQRPRIAPEPPAGPRSSGRAGGL
jgi:cytochrome c oxidase subunit 2